MRLSRFEFVLAFAVLVASETVYITNLPVYKALAPCASNIISYVVQGLTDSKCPALVTPLASCACTQDQNSASINSRIASSVLYSCGSTATEDVASASVAFSAYCNQATPYVVPTPTAGAVSKYISDLPAFSDLGPCAGTALNYVINYLTNYKCPTGASALQSCACTKNQIPLAVTEAISTSVAYYCGTTHSADVASAQAVFVGYCGLAKGTSIFPSPSYLPGNVNYYITALPQYTALASCARSAVSYPIQGQTAKNCPSEPKALVSCICAKDGNLDAASSAIQSSVSYYCGSTANADITSALAVLDYYCSAGKGLVTPQGVTAIVTQTAKTTAKTTTATVKGGATATDGGPAATSTSTEVAAGGSTTDITTSGKIRGVPVAAIAGGVGGAAIFIIFMLFVLYRYRRRQKNKPKPPPVVPEDSTFASPPPTYSTVEPSGNPANRIPPKEPLGNVVYTPVSPMGEVDTRPHVNAAELGGYTPNNQARYEAPGSTQRPVEMPGSNSRSGPWYEMHVP